MSATASTDGVRRFRWRQRERIVGRTSSTEGAHSSQTVRGAGSSTAFRTALADFSFSRSASSTRMTCQRPFAGEVSVFALPAVRTTELIVHHDDLDTTWEWHEAATDAIVDALEVCVARLRANPDSPGLQIVAREGEGRFVVLGPGAGLHAQELERRIRVGLAQSRLAGGGERAPRLAVEAGAAVLAPWDEGGVSDLLVRAEQALAQRRALRRSVPQHGWGRRRSDRGDRSARPERPGA